MSFPPAAFFASVYQTSIPGSSLKLTNFPLPAQSFFIGIPYIIVFPCAETPSNAADALEIYDKGAYDSLNNVPFLMDYIRGNIFLKQGCSKKIGLWGTNSTKDTKFQISDNNFKSITQSGYDTIKPILQKINNNETITPAELITVKQYINIKGVVMYTNHGYFQYGQQFYYFSTLDNGTTLYYSKTFDYLITSYTISGITVNPDNAHTYKVYRYFTSLKYGDVNLNTDTSFELGWSSSDISGNYGDDIALLSIYIDQPGPTTQLGQSSIPVKYNFQVTTTTKVPGTNTLLMSTIPSGRYYFGYDFVSPRYDAITSAGYFTYFDLSGNSLVELTPSFTFITQFPKSISATNTIPRDITQNGTTIPSGTTIITGDIGIGYPYYTYLLTIKDSVNFSRRVGITDFPYAYKPPPATYTRTYAVILSDSSDTYNTGSLSTTFTAYQYVANLAIATRIIQSERNFLTWTSGSTIEQFKYGTTDITTDGSLNFNSGQKVDTSGFTAGTGYQFIPSNVFETNPAPGAYPTVYFDSVAPNQTVNILKKRAQQTYTILWTSYYTESSPAPDGIRQYTVTFTGNGTTYTSTSNYNVVTIPYSAVAFNVPYTIKVEDIQVATNVYFFDKPTNFDITPNKINFSNTITWVSNGNPMFNVRMGRYLFQRSSSFTVNLTQDIIDKIGVVYFWPVGSDESTAILITSYSLSVSTISVTLPSSIPIFSGATLSFDVGAYLYPSDTYSLSLYRNGEVFQQLEATITNPFTFFPYKYTVTYQAGDRLYIKSNQHLNYGISPAFNLDVNPPTNIEIIPNKINFTNTISWSVDTNPEVNVKIGNYTFLSRSPYTQNFTEDIGLTGTILFWPLGADSTKAVVGRTYTLSENTILVNLPSTILVLSGATLTFDVGSYLYPSDTYSLSLYRNGVIQQLEATITSPFTFIPYKYLVTYQPNDQLYIKSNQHLNFGLSNPFTLVVNTPINVRVTPSSINFSNTISWSVENNPVLNVKIGNNTFQSRSPYTYDFKENLIDLEGDISFWQIGADPSRAIVAENYTLSANTISMNLPSSILLFSGVTFTFNVGAYLYPSDTYSLSLYRNGVVQQLEATITSPFTFIPYKYLVTYQPNDQLYIKSNQHLNFGLSVPFTLNVNTPTNIQIIPNKINFTNTISWSVDTNPVLNVKIGNYIFQSRSPYTYDFTENIQRTGTISFWPIGADPSNAVVAGNYALSDNTIYVALPSSFPVFSNVFFSFDIGAVLYRNDRYSLSLYRNGAVVKELEASITTPFTWFPYKYVVTYQPGDQIYVKSNQHLNYGLSVPFTLQVNASVVVDKLIYKVFSTVIATMTIDKDVAFTARLIGPSIIPVAFTQEGNQYTIQLKDYSIPLGNYRLEFIFVNSPTIIVPSQTFLVTTDVTLDQLDYTIVSTINASVYVGVPTTFTVVLQDIDHLFPPIPLPPFTANLLSTYSFNVYGLPVQDANYILQFTSNVVLTSPVFFISQSYFSFDELILPTPPSRATTNTLCVTSKKNNIPTIIISIKNNIVYPTAIRGERQYLVPCGVLPYLKELTELIKTMTLRNALLFLIQKYNIPQNTPPVTNQKRYQLPTANFKVLSPIVQYTASFRLAGSTPGVSVGYDIRFVDKLSDARFVTLCNDDTKTFSSLYTDMLKNATYWISTLARFTKDGDFTYCVVRPVNGSLKQILTGSITLVNNRLVFTPYILRLVLAFYQPYKAIDMTIMYSSKSLEDIYNYLVAAYEKIYLNPATAL